MQQLTQKQMAIFRYVETRLDEGCCPSQQEIARHFHMHQNSVFQIITYLRNKGYLASTAGHRQLRLSDQYLRSRSSPTALPLVGKVAAGRPTLAVEDVESHLDVQKLLGLSHDTFALRVQGDSMVDEGIMDSDLVVVKPGADVRSGDIAVVLVDDEATVKRVEFQKNTIALKSANRAARYKTIYINHSQKDVRIVGRVTGCIRAI